MNHWKILLTAIFFTLPLSRSALAEEQTCDILGSSAPTSPPDSESSKTERELRALLVEKPDPTNTEAVRTWLVQVRGLAQKLTPPSGRLPEIVQEAFAEVRRVDVRPPETGVWAEETAPVFEGVRVIWTRKAGEQLPVNKVFASMSEMKVFKNRVPFRKVISISMLVIADDNDLTPRGPVREAILSYNKNGPTYAIKERARKLGLETHQNILGFMKDRKIPPGQKAILIEYSQIAVLAGNNKLAYDMILNGATEEFIDFVGAAKFLAGITDVPSKLSSYDPRKEFYEGLRAIFHGKD